MDYYFANKAALIEFLQKNLVLDLETEHGYYGEIAFEAKVILDGEQIMRDSESASSGYSYCDCGTGGGI